MAKLSAKGWDTVRVFAGRGGHRVVVQRRRIKSRKVWALRVLQRFTYGAGYRGTAYREFDTAEALQEWLAVLDNVAAARGWSRES